MSRQILLQLTLSALVAASLGCGNLDDGSTPDLLETPPQGRVASEEGSSSAPAATVEPENERSAVHLGESLTLGSDAASDLAVTLAPDAESGETMSANFAQTTWDTTSEREFLSLLNEERTSRGKNALKIYWDLEDDARNHALLMDQRDNLHHNPNLGSVTLSGYWSRIGENVGGGGSVPSLHRAFMDSPGHRDNILGDYTHVGIGVHNEGTIWVTVVFMKAAKPGLENTYGPFHDDDFNPHEAAIHKIWKAGVTFGCGGQRYCPDREVSRGEMAAFLTRALGLAPASRDYFDDDGGKFYEASANAMYESGVTFGCGERRYCGDEQVTRGQMAAFLDRAFQLPDSGRDYFTDDDKRFYEASANALGLAGITNGCGGSKFCGEQPLPRDQMAAFLARALNL